MNISWNKKIILGVFTIVAGVILLSLDTIETSIGLAVINAGSIITIASYASSRKEEKIAHDERTRRLGAKAASYSWVFTFTLLAILVWILEYTQITISTQFLLGLLLAEMSLSMLISKWYLNKKDF